MDTGFLRAATRTEHEATEASVPLMDPKLGREQYVRCLRGFLSAVGAWDAWSMEHCPTPLLPLISNRQRSDLLRADLAFFGAGAKEWAPVVHAPWIPDGPCAEDQFRAMFLGAMYVVEGSTLGGQYIARHVESVLHLTPGHGNRYFCGYGEHTGAMWREFKTWLAAVPDIHTSIVVESAKRMFAFYAAQMNSN